MTRKTERSSKLEKPSTRDAILDAAETLMSERGFHAVGMREIARTAGINLGGVTYHFGTKENLLAEIYARHTRPMNQRRLDMLAEAERISDPDDRLLAIIRAFVVPAFSSRSDIAGGGARFTRLRAILSMEGNEAAKRIIAESFDETSSAIIDAIGRCVPDADRGSIVWRCHFLLGALYYALVSNDRIDRLAKGATSGSDHERAIDELVRSSAASLKDLAGSARSGDKDHAA
ncbi:TetR family transcriptional regulator [Alphaproteobacteria bacterium HT1-32]|nr:TetR family transcriptional regulator [Alphaproteobacteria bacterium HT1-32]